MKVFIHGFCVISRHFLCKFATHHCFVCPHYIGMCSCASLDALPTSRDDNKDPRDDELRRLREDHLVRFHGFISHCCDQCDVSKLLGSEANFATKKVQTREHIGVKAFSLYTVHNALEGRSSGGFSDALFLFFVSCLRGGPACGWQKRKKDRK